MLPAVTTCLESHCTSAVVSKYKEKLQSLVMQSLCNVLPGVGGSLVTEIDQKNMQWKLQEAMQVHSREKLPQHKPASQQSPVLLGGKACPVMTLVSRSFCLTAVYINTKLGKCMCLLEGMKQK